MYEITQKQLLIATIILFEIFLKYVYLSTPLPMYLIVAYLKKCIGGFGTISTFYVEKCLSYWCGTCLF